jgi:hypothetical protein
MVTIEASHTFNHYLLTYAPFGEWGQYGKAEYCLLDSLGEIVWVTQGPISASPRVADDGTTATLSTFRHDPRGSRCIRVVFRDRDGAITGDTELLTVGRQHPSFRIGEVYGFHPGGQSFVITTNAREEGARIARDTTLHCLDPDGAHLWQRRLGAIDPLSLGFSSDGTRITIGDLLGGQVGQSNSLFVFSNHGEEIAHFRMLLPTTCAGMLLDSDEGVIYSFDVHDGLCAIDLRDGARSTRRPMAEIGSFLFSSNDRTRQRAEFYWRQTSWFPRPERDVVPPVWVLIDADSKPEVVVNWYAETSYGKSFPERMLPLRRADVVGNPPRILPIQVMRISSDGTLSLDTPEAKDLFVADDHADTALRCPSDDSDYPLLITGRPLPRRVCKDLRSWHMSRDSSLFAAAGDSGLWLYDLTADTSYLATSHLTWDLQSTPSGSAIAGIESDRESELTRVAVRARTGEAIAASPWMEEDWYPGFHFFATGKHLHFQRGRDSVLCLTVPDDMIGQPLQVSPWDRLYSENDRRMMDWCRPERTLRVYDVTQPDDPVPLGTLYLDPAEYTYIESAVLSRDGSLVVLALLREPRISPPLCRVIAFDDSLRRQTTVVENTVLRDLYINDDCLFVGIVKEKNCFSRTSFPTTCVKAYDLDDIRAMLVPRSTARD